MQELILNSNIRSPLWRAFEDAFFDSNSLDSERIHPRWEDKEGYFQLTLDIPGVDPKNISVKVQNQCLSITAKEGEDKNHYRSYNTSFSLPSCVNIGKISAHSSHGVLDILLPKKEENKAFNIEVKSGEKTQKPNEQNTERKKKLQHKQA